MLSNHTHIYIYIETERFFLPDIIIIILFSVEFVIYSFMNIQVFWEIFCILWIFIPWLWIIMVLSKGPSRWAVTLHILNSSWSVVLVWNMQNPFWVLDVQASSWSFFVSKPPCYTFGKFLVDQQIPYNCTELAAILTAWHYCNSVYTFFELC